MTIVQALILGVIQGLTEFLPISSSGHLILVEAFFNLDVEKLLDFDITLHMGTLLAILIYFRKDIWEILKFKDRKIITFLIVGTIPAVVLGFLFKDQIETTFRSVTSVSILMIFVGILFLLPENLFIKTQKKLNFKNSILIGLSQACALIPGVSRSGATILSGTWLGINRKEAARFSFLLGSIAMIGAGILAFKDFKEIAMAPEILLVGFVGSFISGFFAIKFLMHFLGTHSLKIFGIYRIALGILLIAWQIPIDLLK